MRERIRKNLTIPNLLTLVRLLLIPLYWWLMMVRQDDNLALAVFLLASLTDLVDGYIARHFNQVTDLGKLFDPLADKLMVLSVMLSLVLREAMPLSILVIILLKESLMVLGGVLMLRHKVVVFAKPIGKIAQFVIVLGLLLSFFRQHFQSLPLHLIVLWTGVVLTLGALVFYTHACLTAIRNERRAQRSKEDNQHAS